MPRNASRPSRLFWLTPLLVALPLLAAVCIVSILLSAIRIVRILLRAAGCLLRTC